jgi:dienelactone hydrolase
MQRTKTLLYAAVCLLAFGLGTPPVVSGPTPSGEGARREPYKPTPEELREAYQRSGQFPQARRVYKDRITPHWLPNNTRFWYRNDLHGGGREFVLVDAERGIRQAAFDHKKLAAALSKAAGADYQADRLPFDSIEFLDEEKAIRFKVGNTTWKCDLTSYQCSKTEASSFLPPPEALWGTRLAPEDLARQESHWPDGIAPDPETFEDQQTIQREQEPKRTARSPDGKWTAFVKDAGFPDRICWHQAVAKKYPYYDISRVGIYGGSAGGQNATAGVLFHPEFYKVAVSSCGCHDNRMDKASWNEQWMGYPVGPQYAASSNIDNAYRLRGKLLLIVGELDTNVPPESTLRLVDALIKANKDFDLVVVPGAGHGSGGAYGNWRRRDFFVRHLLGVEPPDRNAGPRLGGE